MADELGNARHPPCERSAIPPRAPTIYKSPLSIGIRLRKPESGKPGISVRVKSLNSRPLKRASPSQVAIQM